MRSWFYLENHPFPHSVLNYRLMYCHAYSSDRKKIHLVDMRILHSSAFQGHAARALYCS